MGAAARHAGCAAQDGYCRRVGAVMTNGTDEWGFLCWVFYSAPEIIEQKASAKKPWFYIIQNSIFNDMYRK